MGTRRASSVGVRELRQNLSIYLDRVKKGEALTVTEHGAAVAVLRPLAAASTLFERLAAEGRATVPSRTVAELPTPLKISGRRPVSRLLDDERTERL